MSYLRPHRRARRFAYTAVEMLTTVAVLVIVLGLMVSLARRVRSESADSITKSVLLHLERAMAEYKRVNGGSLPAVTPFVPDGATVPDEATLQRRALQNNRELVRALKGQLVRAERDAKDNQSGGGLGDLPVSIYDEATLRDAWGTPVVFLPHFHRAIGVAPGGEYFFVSAGPDGKFLTRADNLYSYESLGTARTPVDGGEPTSAGP